MSIATVCDSVNGIFIACTMENETIKAMVVLVAGEPDLLNDTTCYSIHTYLMVLRPTPTISRSSMGTLWHTWQAP